MTALRIDTFQGMAPRLAPRQLGPSQSQLARNCDLFSGELRPLRTNLVVDNPTKTGIIQSMYPLGGKWLAWTTDVDVAPAPLSLGQQGRVYYTGDYNPKATDINLATTGVGTDYPLAFYRLGVMPPDTAPTVATTGGSAANVTRGYAYTFVTPWGEEGPASPLGSATGPSDATWNITGMDGAPPNSGTISSVTVNAASVDLTFAASHFLETGDYIIITGTITGTGTLVTDLVGTWKATRTGTTTVNIALVTTGTYTSGASWAREAPLQLTGWQIRLYRTVGTTYYMVTTQAASIGSYNDTTADGDLGTVTLPGGTETGGAWSSPPGDLQGILALPNGIMVGFFDNVLCFSEAWQPSAWPIKYQIKLPYNIVGLGAFGNTIVVTTEGYPHIVTGSDPGSMSEARLEFAQSCVSKRSVVSSITGVMYASPEGIAYVPSAGAPEVITRRWMLQADWQLFNPSSVIGAVYDGRYYGFYTGAGASGTEYGAVVFDPRNPEAAFTELDMNVAGAYYDITTGALYLLESRSITKYQGGGGYLTFEWQSKIFTDPRPVSYTAAKVNITFVGAIPAAEYDAALAAATAAVDANVAAHTVPYMGGFNGAPCNYYAVNSGPYTDAVRNLGTPATATFQYYRDETLIHEQQLTGPGVFRLPQLVRGTNDSIAIAGNGFKCHRVTLGETVSDLASV